MPGFREYHLFASLHHSPTAKKLQSALTAIVAVFASCTVASAEDVSPIRDGDRIVMVGDGFVEQSQYSGWIESFLTAANADKTITFRNIGWSADTPAGASRTGLSLVQAGREAPGEGWRQLEKQLELTKPTLLIVGYGMASALECCETTGGAAERSTGIGQRLTSAAEQFREELQRLVDATRKITPQARFVFISPVDHLTASQEQLLSIAKHRRVLEAVAEANSSSYISLERVANAEEQRQSAIRLNSRGYRDVALHLVKKLRMMDSLNENLGTRLDDIATDESFGKLRDVVLRKNEWWFHRSRPANMAYVFGFRKHEQGQNAGEIPQFDKLIAEEEARIRRLANLDAQADVELPPARLESAFAEFDEQPLPEFTVHPDWEISLWAQNPLLNKPIHMNFDAQGRLWVASSEAYPMIEVGQSAPDRIVVLEDTSGDGKADKSEIFAEGLLIPTGVLPGDGGVYVAQSTDLLHLKDTDGDMKADEKTRVLSGFGTEDTHHNLHTLLWGPDGRLFMNQSVYTRSDLETPLGIVRLKAGGGMRLNTANLKTNVFFRGLWNSWGHRFDRYGQSFLTDGAGFAGIAYGFPGATFNPTPGARHQLDLISPGSWPKFASLEIIDGANYPEDWQGSLVTCDFRANRVTRFSLAEDAAGFVTKQEADLVRTSAATFRPIDVKLGPDGALYIADWSNPIINHGEVDFRDARRDRWHGRIWRLEWKGATASAMKRDLAALSDGELFGLLTEGDGYERTTARKLLSDRLVANPDAAPVKLAEWLAVKDSKADTTTAGTSPLVALEVLWLSQATESLNSNALELCLKSDDGRVRAAAVRTLGTAFIDGQVGSAQEASWRGPLVNALADEFPRVRLEAIRALSRDASVANATRALDVLSLPMDRFIEHALTLTVNEVAEELAHEIESGDWLKTQATSEKDGDLASRKLEFIVTKIEPSLASGLLSNFLASNKLAESTDGPWIELIGKAGGRAELQQLLEATVAGELSESATLRALESLEVANRLRKQRPTNVSSVAQLLDPSSHAEKTVQSAMKLIGSWRMKGQAARLIRIASNADAPVGVRATAIDTLRVLGAAQSVDLLTKLASNPKAARTIQKSALRSLTELAPENAVEPFIAMLSRATDTAAAQAIWREYLGAPGFTEKVGAALPEANLDDFVVDAGRQVVSTRGEAFASLKSVLDQMGTQAEKLIYSPELVAKITAGLEAANPARGELVYRRNELACVTCHAIGGVGGKVGPDMTSLGASAPVDYIIESLVDPAAKVKEGYHSVSVATEEGQVFTGIQVSSDDDKLVLRDANGKLIEVPQIDIIGKKAASSLMPSGVVDRLTDEERVDLVAFLSQLGKPGRFDASRGGVARQYDIFAGTHRIEQLGSERITSGELRSGWKPATALVSGDLPSETIVELTKQPRNIALVHVYARTTAQVAQESTVTFTVNSPAAALWIDGVEVERKRAESAPSEPDNSKNAARFTTTLSAGDHLVLVRLDARDLPEALRLQAENVTFSAPATSLKDGADKQ